MTPIPSTRPLLFAALLVGFLGVWAPGCVTSVCATEECYEVCDTFCDGFVCWRECSVQCYCVELVECLSNRDCPRGNTCVNGDCRVLPVSTQGLCETCTSHTQCIESGALCVSLPGGGERVCGRSCHRDADCPSGFDCALVDGGGNTQCLPSSGSCGSVAAGCTASSQCTESQRCERGACVSVSQTCGGSVVCQVGASCEGGRCQSIACNASTPCPAGALCLDGECRAQCTSNAQCAADRVCSAGACVSPDRVQCARSVDCAAGEQCVDASCKQSCVGTDATCPAGFYRLDSWCEVDPRTGCQDDTACAAGSNCLGGVCVTPAP